MMNGSFPCPYGYLQLMFHGVMYEDIYCSANDLFIVRRLAMAQRLTGPTRFRVLRLKRHARVTQVRFACNLLWA